MRKIGYGRVSTGDQEIAGQIDELKKFGCEEIFTDVISGAKARRPGLKSCLEALQSGDTLIVLRLDRLGRSMSHLVSIVTDLRERGVAFKSLHDGLIDTTSASGELVFHIFAALSQFERKLIQERTLVGLEAARARGKHGGRKILEASNMKVRMAKTLHKDETLDIDEICEQLQISRATFYRYLKL